MNQVIELMFVFVVLGLARERLKQWTYPLMVLAIAVYLIYAFRYH